eukprot:175792-Pyramimonas_sp.AAC.1
MGRSGEERAECEELRNSTMEYERHGNDDNGKEQGRLGKNVEKWGQVDTSGDLCGNKARGDWKAPESLLCPLGASEWPR